jgi:hypothetical protein
MNVTQPTYHDVVALYRTERISYNFLQEADSALKAEIPLSDNEDN